MSKIITDRGDKKDKKGSTYPVKNGYFTLALMRPTAFNYRECKTKGNSHIL